MKNTLFWNSDDFVSMKVCRTQLVLRRSPFRLVLNVMAQLGFKGKFKYKFSGTEKLIEIQLSKKMYRPAWLSLHHHYIPSDTSQSHT